MAEESVLRRTTLLRHLVGIISKDTGLTEVGASREASLTLVTQQLLGGDAQLQHANIHARTQLSGAVDDWCCTLGKQLSKVGGIFKAVLAIISTITQWQAHNLHTTFGAFNFAILYFQAHPSPLAVTLLGKTIQTCDAERLLLHFNTWGASLFAILKKCSSATQAKATVLGVAVCDAVSKLFTRCGQRQFTCRRAGQGPLKSTSSS
jgi:hypothetical protein